MKPGCWESYSGTRTSHQLCSHFLFRMELRPPQAQKSHTNSVPHCERNTNVSYSRFLVCQDMLPHFSQAGFRQSWGQVCESQCLREDLRGAYAEPTRGYAISSSHSGVLGSPKVLRFYSRRSIPDLHKTNHSCAPNCLEIFLNKPIIGTKQANHNSPMQNEYVLTILLTVVSECLRKAYAV